MTKEELKRHHEIFMLMAKLTVNAETLHEVAKRFIDAGLVTTEEPSQSLYDYMNDADTFYSELADQLWQKDKDPNFANDPNHESGAKH